MMDNGCHFPIIQTTEHVIRPNLMKVDFQFYMETDGKLMFAFKTLKIKLLLFYSPSQHYNQLYNIT